MAFTEFCCRSGGSNLNAGTRSGSSTEPGTSPSFTYASGSWVAATGVFTVASGNPSTDGVAVGDFVSVYPDGSTVAVFIGRVTAVSATTITVSLTAKAGTAPVDGTNNRTLRVGGAWKGPNAAENFPFGFVQSTLTNAAGDPPRVNLKNDANFSVTAAVSHSNAGLIAWRGYNSAYADGGRATLDGGTSGASYTLLTLGAVNNPLEDFIVQNNGATGSADGLSISVAAQFIRRVTANSIRGTGINLLQTNNEAVECEAYLCNQSNTANKGGFALATNGRHSTLRRCISHDNAGSNTAGFFLTTGSADSLSMEECIADSNGGHGLNFGGDTRVRLYRCDFYNNGGDGVRLANTSNLLLAFIESCNFIKNAGWGINGSGAGTRRGRLDANGFGAGTQVNTSGRVTGLSFIEEASFISYANDVTPWTDPANGDFRVALAAAKGAGRGLFMQSQASYAGTVGYPDVGAAQHQDAGATRINRGILSGGRL